jgi:hypothetical protein
MAPLLYVVSREADSVNGWRFDANLWDPSLPPAGRPADLEPARAAGSTKRALKRGTISATFFIAVTAEIGRESGDALISRPPALAFSLPAVAGEIGASYRRFRSSSDPRADEAVCCRRSSEATAAGTAQAFGPDSGTTMYDSGL